MNALREQAAYMREQAALHGSHTLQLGPLFARVTAHGNAWALELQDTEPIDNRVLDGWALAFGLPRTTAVAHNAKHTIWRAEWTTDDEPAPEGTRAFYLGGAR